MKLIQNNDAFCDTAYDTLALRQIPKEHLRPIAYQCRFCGADHLVLSHGPEDDFTHFQDLFIRCLGSCEHFVRIRVKV